MIKLSLSEEEISALHALYSNHPQPKVKQRALILILKSEDIPHHKIAKVAHVCENTVRSCFYAYSKNGIEGLKVLNFYQPESALKPFDSVVRAYFTETPPATISEACFEVERRTKVSLKNTQMRKYIKAMDIKYRKVNTVPAKADLEAQEKFHDEELQPRLQEACAKKRQVYFVDAAHFVQGAFLGFLWSFTRLFVRTPSGRQRFNVLGALNALTKELIMITNETYITSVQVCELLRKIAENSILPTTLVLDNARYQRCRIVMDLAKELGIELLFLPPYSPNLNLIERLWKLTKKECLYSKYYENFDLFCKAIQGFLATMHLTHQEKLSSLLTLKFQKFTEEQFRLAA